MGNAGSSQQWGSGANDFSLGQMAASTKFSKDELRHMHTAFMAAAKASSESGSTVITREQFGEILSAAQWGHSENAGFLSALYDAFDKNGDGLVNFAEFTAGASVILKGTPDEKYQVRSPRRGRESAGRDCRARSRRDRGVTARPLRRSFASRCTTSTSPARSRRTR